MPNQDGPCCESDLNFKMSRIINHDAMCYDWVDVFDRNRVSKKEFWCRQNPLDCRASPSLVEYFFYKIVLHNTNMNDFDNDNIAVILLCSKVFLFIAPLHFLILLTRRRLQVSKPLIHEFELSMRNAGQQQIDWKVGMYHCLEPSFILFQELWHGVQLIICERGRFSSRTTLNSILSIRTN